MSKPFNPTLTKNARKLRKTETLAESILWNKLKNKQMLGYKFRRQGTLLNYIVDFYCIKAKLVIEIDGMSHDDTKYNYDTARQKNLENIGCRVLRFSEFEVKSRVGDVLQSIENALTISPPVPEGIKGRSVT